MNMIKSYKDLQVWQKSVELVKEVYRITKHFPKSERFGLIDQIRRCSVSIPSNIAEGKARQHINEYIQFLYIALGSCAELDTQMTIAKELNFAPETALKVILTELTHITKMIRKLITNLRYSK